MALFCGEEFLFSVDMETYFAQHLAPGMCLEEEELEQLWQKSQLRKAKDKALQYLSLRDYASGELYDKLRLKYDERASAAAVAAMAELGLLNDEGFARHRMKYLMGQNKSRSQIRRHLQEKGIDRAIIEPLLEELYQQQGENEIDPEVATAVRLIEKSYGRKLEQGKKENVLAALARRGFSLGTARQAIEIWQENQEAAE